MLNARISFQIGWTKKKSARKRQEWKSLENMTFASGTLINDSSRVSGSRQRQRQRRDAVIQNGVDLIKSTKHAQRWAPCNYTDGILHISLPLETETEWCDGALLVSFSSRTRWIQTLTVTRLLFPIPCCTIIQNHHTSNYTQLKW